MSRRSIKRAEPGQHTAWQELMLVLHDEVSRLPERFRLPVIMSYLEGKTSEEIAELLHWRVGMVDRRLSRAGALLRSRLMRRGMARSAAHLLTAVSRSVVFAEVVPTELINRTVRLVSRRYPRLLAGDSAGFSTPVAPEMRASRRGDSD
jgi:RNA polymerase sigma-70 factor (ECF subfamily)